MAAPSPLSAAIRLALTQALHGAEAPETRPADLVWPPVPAEAESPQGRLARLERALRTERRLGRAGHWSYDLGRHIALMRMTRAARRAERGVVSGSESANKNAAPGGGALDSR